MKTVSAALKAHFAQPYQTTATCWKVTLTNTTVKAFTDHDKDIPFDGVTYLAASGYTASDVNTAAGLNVDNMEVQGLLNSPSITEADLNAGLWDYAKVEIFVVNWADLTMGKMYLRVGHLGEVQTGRDAFKAEIRGLTQAYSRTMVSLYSPSCRAVLGDTKCAKNLTAFTFAGAVDSVNADNVTFYDTALTQPGPTGGVAITGVSNANPCVISFAAGPTFVDLQVVTLSGILGPTLLNTTTVVHSPTDTSFQLTIDTSDTGVYPAYAGGGTITALGSTTGYFDFGLVTWLTGLNAGLKMEVRSYTTGQVQLQLPMPYQIQVGDTYNIAAGCDHTFPTCRDKFSNAVNFRGEPYLPGQDKVIQVGRR